MKINSGLTFQIS